MSRVCMFDLESSNKGNRIYRNILLAHSMTGADRESKQLKGPLSRNLLELRLRAFNLQSRQIGITISVLAFRSC